MIPDRFRCYLLVLLFLAGCASTPISRYEDIARNFKVPDGHALLYLYREGLGGIAGHDQVIIDAKRTLDVTHDGYYVIELSPGTYMDRPALQGESSKGNKGKVAHIYPAFD